MSSSASYIEEAARDRNIDLTVWPARFSKAEISREPSEDMVLDKLKRVILIYISDAVNGGT